MGIHAAQYIDSYLPSVDGVVTVVQNYARVLNEQYGDCCVFAPASPGYTDHDPFPIHRFRSLPVPKRAPYRLSMPSLDGSYRRLAADSSFEILHAHSPFTSGHAALRLAKKKNIPLVATFHSKFYDDFKEATGSDRIARLGVKYVVNFFNQADFVWSVNAATANTLKDYGYRGEVTVIPNGTDPGAPADALERITQVTGELSLSPQKPTFLFVGQIIWQKNLRLICQSLAEYKRRGHDFNMIFVGTGVALEELKALTKELGIGENTVFTGMILDRDYLKSIFLTADLFLFPSIYDNAPLVVREAAAVGTPSLLIRGSNAAEGIIDCDNGFLSEETPVSIADTIEKVAADPALGRRVGQKAGETLPLSWDRVVAMAYDNYQDILSHWKGRD